MSSVNTAFKVYYNQTLGDHPAILGGGENAPWPLVGIDAPVNLCFIFRSITKLSRREGRC